MTEADRARMEAAARFAADLCICAGEDQAFYDAFWSGLVHHIDILREFIYYMEKDELACRAKAGGVTAADILVWQIDHFKAAMDRDRKGLDCDRKKMVLYAFATMLRLADEPERYREKLFSETGTDYPGKFGGL